MACHTCFTDFFKSMGVDNKRLLKPLSHWTATVLRQLATDIASGSQSSLETVAIDSKFPRMCRQVAQSSCENFEHVPKFYATKSRAKWSQSHPRCGTRREVVADPSQFSRSHFGTQHICEINKTELRKPIAT